MSNQKIKSITIVDKRDNTVIFTSGEKKDFIEIVAEYEKPKSNVLFALNKNEIQGGQPYWYIGSDNSLYEDSWGNTSIDIARFNLNNVFLTKENAQKQADRNQLLADIERFAAENNGEIDWSEVNKTKYFISYDNLDNKWVGDSNSKYKIQGTTYFSSATIAAQALEKFKDRLDILLD
jgi:hypothetical protein